MKSDETLEYRHGIWVLSGLISPEFAPLQPLDNASGSQQQRSRLYERGCARCTSDAYTNSHFTARVSYAPSLLLCERT